MIPDEAVARVIRETQEDLRALAGNTILVAPADGLAIVAKTVDGGSYPTTAGVVYMGVIQDIDADDTEGAVATFTDDTDEEGTPMVPLLNIGGNVPPAGTRVIAVSTSAKWVFVY
jgi:hypothetical protein